MNRKTVMAGVLVLTAVGAVALRTQWFRPVAPLVVAVRQAPFEETIELRGHIEPQRFEDILAPSTKTERQLIQTATEGAFVQAGDVVAEFDPGPLLLYIESLKERLREMDMSREELEVLMDARIFDEQVGVESSGQNLILAEIRRRTLNYEAGLRQAGGEVEVNIAKRKIISAQGRLGQVDRQKKTRMADRVEDAAVLLERIRDVEEQLKQYTVAASAASIVVYPPIPIAGELRKAVAGDYLERGQSFLRLPDLSSLVIRGYLEESQMNRVAPGFKARIRPVAYPAMELTGEVLWVSRVATLLPGRARRQYFEVIMRYDPAGNEALIKVGMVVNVSIQIEHHGVVFAVPRDLAQADEAGWRVKLFREDAPPESLPLKAVVESGDYLLVREWAVPVISNEVRLVYEAGNEK